MAPPTVSPTATKKTNRSGLVVAVVLGITIPVVLVFMLWVCSSVKGTEFSPHNFQTRSFAFSELPFLGIQLENITRSSQTDSTSRYLIANKLISLPTGNAKPRWDLVRIHRAFRTNTTADPSVLTSHLDGRGSTTIDWEQWSKDNNKAAAIFWPFVQQMAFDELYLMMPRVFELAENQSDPVQLQADLDEYLQSELPTFAEDLVAAGRSKTAQTALSNAVKRYPQNQKLKDQLDKLSASQL